MADKKLSMKKHLSICAFVLLCLGLLPARAQFGAGGSPFDNVISKVFGTNLNFSADMEAEVKLLPKQQDISLGGKMYFSGGNSRSEMDMTTMKNSQMTPQMIAQMKSMGMDKVVSISLADRKTAYMVYPGLQAYAKIEQPDADNSATNDFKVESTDLGKETWDGHPCLKKRYTVTNTKTGQSLVMTAWNATDLQNCPIKIEQSAWASGDSFKGNSATMLFKNVSLTKPAASLFAPPAGYKAYDNIQAMMRAEMMKHMGGAGH
jgi:hypothetical protein